MLYIVVKWLVIAGILFSMFGWKGIVLVVILFYLKEIEYDGVLG
jgi:hypothetical protein